MAVNTIISTRVTETGTEPVSIEQAKIHAAIDYTDYDSILPIYLSAARQSIEKATSIALISKKVNLTVSLVANTLFRLPDSPVSQVNYIISTLNNSTASYYTQDQSNVGAANDFVIVEMDGLYDIEYECSVSSVQADLKIAIMQMFTFIFNHRGEYSEGKLNYSVEAERIVGQNARFQI